MNLFSKGPTLFIDTCAPVLQIALSVPCGTSNDANNMKWQSISLPCDSHHFHSSRMIPSIQALFEQFDITASDLKAIGVNVGPGSFTGLRTGVVTTRALAQFLPLSVYQFNTLELWAWHAMQGLQESIQSPAGNQPDTVAIYHDALRGRAFHAVYKINVAENTLMLLEKPCLKLLTESPLRPGVTGAPSSEPLNLPPETKILTSPSLQPWLENRGYGLSFTPDTISTTAMMRDILESPQGESHQIPWKNLSPLYLQEPSITLKPGFVPLTPSRLVD